MSDFKSGFVGIVGPTNSGKSTLLNSLVGEKLSIVSKLPQTTQHALKGIVNGKNYQLIFIDTPGFQRYPETIPRLLNRVADHAAEECDLLLWVFDASSNRVFDQVEKLENRISKLKKVEDRICLLNKIDLMPKGELLPLIQRLHDKKLFSEIIPISAQKRDGVERLVKILVPRLISDHPYYEKGQLTDRTIAFRMSELIREKVFLTTRQEIPYSVYVEMEEEGADPQAARVPTYRAVLHVDSDSRKGILIGKGGETLKKIGIAARQDIEKILGHQICLKLHVHVEGQWRDDADKLHRYLELN